MHGIGRIYSKHGAVFKGNFKLGKKHGKGYQRDNNGIVFEEDWENNVLISKKELPGSIDFDNLWEHAKQYEKARTSPRISGGFQRDDSSEKLPQDSDSPNKTHNHYAPARNSRMGNETLSLKEFKEELGSFEGLDNDTLVAKWGTETVVQFLIRGGLEEYAEAFRVNQIVGENLLKMTDEDLQDLGIKARGHISKFIYSDSNRQI